MDGKKKDEVVSLNVGGQVHQTLWSTLEKLPESRLGRLASATTEEERKGLVDKFADNSYFFDRQSSFFSEILNYYRTGELWIPEDVCPTAVSTELEYWGIQEKEMMSYCLDRLLERREELTGPQLDIKEEKVEGGTLWKVLEKPGSSIIAKVYTGISCGVLVLATLVLILNTMPSVQHTNQDGKLLDNPVLQYVEIPCIIFFVVELILRFVVAPDKKSFLLDPLNILDAVGNLAFLIEFVIELFGEDQSMEVLRILRIMRVFRIIRFISESKSIQCIRYVLRHSVKEILVLTLFLFYGVLMFATLGYYAEHTEDNEWGFTSIPASMWWSLVTMTTVGFGDVTPVTATGKIIGSLAAFSGVFVMVLPIPFFVHSASEFYKADEAARQRRLRTKQTKLDKE